ncbi:RNA 2',3'-cyclic phosphodiesterase [Ramlibacter sp. AW1]|uniref:RNA 2',3'-cyclic phosphodiesterase n=1 Tax=Ramlibacter aurantiacus TaxID=2801330 RepID=A0A937D4T8_9BURK|nr:RNA 2',3'-cyclic phosphodiesterase [Ramlibacter aurantiacus]MBL0420652.1 RNA 2',3'-cyclic phosphodiesterase [Ramlibacter aurantiacus]
MSTESTRRLFIGLMADPVVREPVLAWRSRWQWPRRPSLSAPAHLHLTLAFLGDTPEASVDSLRQALAGVRSEPFVLRLGRPQVWPRGLAVVRPDPDRRLDELHRQVRQAVERAGLDPGAGESWKPHLTLARRAIGAQPPVEPLALSWPVSAFSLVWSRLPPLVPRAAYEEIGRWELLTG